MIFSDRFQGRRRERYTRCLNVTYSWRACLERERNPKSMFTISCKAKETIRVVESQIQLPCPTSHNLLQDRDGCFNCYQVIPLDRSGRVLIFNQAYGSVIKLAPTTIRNIETMMAYFTTAKRGARLQSLKTF